MEKYSIILSSITAFAALTALLISIIQITASNRQALFDRRLNAYLNIK